MATLLSHPLPYLPDSKNSWDWKGQAGRSYKIISFYNIYMYKKYHRIKCKEDWLTQIPKKLELKHSKVWLKDLKQQPVHKGIRLLWIQCLTQITKLPWRSPSCWLLDAKENTLEISFAQGNSYTDRSNGSEWPRTIMLLEKFKPWGKY